MNHSTVFIRTTLTLTITLDRLLKPLGLNRFLKKCLYEQQQQQQQQQKQQQQQQQHFYYTN